MSAWLLVAAALAVDPDLGLNEPVDLTAPLRVDPGPVGPVADEPAPPRPRPPPAAPAPIAFVGPPAPAAGSVPVPDPASPPPDPSPLGRQLVAEAHAVRDLVRPLPLLRLAALVACVALSAALARRLDGAGYGASRIVVLLRWLPGVLAAVWLAGAALRAVPLLGIGVLLLLGVHPARSALARIRLRAPAPPPRVTVDHLPAGDPATIRRIALLCPWIRAGSDVVVALRGPTVSVTFDAWSPEAAREADGWLRARL